MHTYRFEFSTRDAEWTHDLPQTSDAAAQTDGLLMLENQAVLPPLTDARLTVAQVTDVAQTRLGTWVWTNGSASWHPADSAP